jgi:predicted molibdopterin-dependent oxidoreductase YjgC
MFFIPGVSMFKRIQSINKPVKFRFENREIIAQEDDSVAAALLAADVIVFRQQPGSDAQRGPFCMIGNCFDCLVEIDGEANRQACQEKVREGMQVRKQLGLRKLGTDDES